MRNDLTNIVVFLFFFQAEDGIRDIGVTGVQTCALPIFFSLAGTVTMRPNLICSMDRVRAHIKFGRIVTVPASEKTRGHDTRSEERRVGKECRSRWSPYH